MTMGERIKQLRSANGFTQEMLAEKMNVSRSAIAKWEAAKVYTRNACRKNECVPFGDCKMGSGKLKLFGLKNRNLMN